MLRLGLAFLALLRAIKAALRGERAAEPTEHLPPGHPDGEPPERRREYPVDTRPGAFNRDTGTFNP